MPENQVCTIESMRVYLNVYIYVFVYTYSSESYVNSSLNSKGLRTKRSQGLPKFCRALRTTTMVGRSIVVHEFSGGKDEQITHKNKTNVPGFA